MCMPTCVVKGMINDCVHESFIACNSNEVKCFLRTEKLIDTKEERKEKTLESLIPFHWHPW